MIRKVLVGVGGWGETYVTLLRQLGKWNEVVAIVDPYARRSNAWPAIEASGIPLYDTLEDFFAQGAAELVIISSPSDVHEAQCLCALSHGAHVLCEKPLTETLQQAHRLGKAARDAGRILGVAFPWSYTPTWQRIKAQIHEGRYGRPISLKSFSSLPRPNAYYESSTWKGRIRDAEGRWVLDSVAANAASHYLHNMFFILGDAPDTARMPAEIEGTLHRGRAIESYDTCFLRGAFADGCRFHFFTSHVSDGRMPACLTCRFEHATLTMASTDSEIFITFDDGSVEQYPVPGSGNEAGEKILQMERAIQAGTMPACHVDTILPHLAVCNAMMDYMPIHDFPAVALRQIQDPPSVEMVGLHEAMRQCYEQERLPGELGFSWAQEPVRVEMKNIHAFEGKLV